MEKKIGFYTLVLLSSGVLTMNCESISSKVTDIDGNTYNTVNIGDQTWMQENLRTTRYNDGTAIPNVTDVTEWRHIEAPAYVWYDNDSANKDIFGALYNWQAVGDRPDLCPADWRVATDDDWKILEMYMGMSREDADGTVWRGTDEGGKMKEEGTKNWNSPNEGATNESGLTLLPSGRRESSGRFHQMFTGTTLWTSTESSLSSAPYRHFGSGSSAIGRNPYGDKKYGMAVRCIKK